MNAQIQDASQGRLCKANRVAAEQIPHLRAGILQDNSFMRVLGSGWHVEGKIMG
jgi:hypothetical protein